MTRETLQRLAAEADAELAPFRDRMPREAYDQSRRACIDRLIRDRTASSRHSLRMNDVAAHPGTVIELDVEKPAAGGRMLARREGHVVLVWGAVPGERVRARVERTGKGVLYAETTDVVSASPDRREALKDWRCGGSVFAHIAYPRQLALKGEIIQDALGRIGHVPLPAPPPVIGSPELGYRMRARLHVRDGRIGFFREGSHDVCDAAGTGQLAKATSEWIAAAQDLVRRERGLAGIEIAENVPGDQRAIHLELHAGADTAPFARLLAIGPLDRPVRATRRSPGGGAPRR